MGVWWGRRLFQSVSLSFEGLLRVAITRIWSKKKKCRFCLYSIFLDRHTRYLLRWGLDRQDTG